MREVYLDIMERIVATYNVEHIERYIELVNREGLTEVGFPRLGANIGILMAHGRRLDLKEKFIEILDICFKYFDHPITVMKADNNFTIREVSCAIKELEKTDVIEKEKIEEWKKKLASFEIETVYTHIASKDFPDPANWAYFGAVSEQARCKLCGLDYTDFLDNQIPSQLVRLDKDGLYRDYADPDLPHQPLLYDMMTRLLLALSVYWGYNGKYLPELEKMMEDSDELTLKMQSVTGEMPFGGRSNQCLFDDTVLAAYFELRASLLSKKGDPKAGVFKAAALKAQKSALYWIDEEPVSQIKNNYDPLLMLGGEGYAYFNSYMVTSASNAYLAYLSADDSIAPTTALADIGGYIAKTSEYFHKVFLNNGDYFIEIDCNADIHYDATGLGRVHKKNCDPRVCLSVPFPSKDAEYKLEIPNRMPMSICGVKTVYENQDFIAKYVLNKGFVTSAQEGAKHILKSQNKTTDKLSAIFDCTLDDEFLFTAEYTVSRDGVDVFFDGADGIMLPVFLFDGKENTDIIAEKGSIMVKYNGSFCKYSFWGDYLEEGVFFNRNGRYRVYRVDTQKIHIEMGEISEL